MYLFNKNKINKWIVKFVLFAILKTVLIIFTTNIENVNHVILKEVQDGILKTKKKYQINIKYIMKKNRDVLLAKSEIYQQNRKSHTQQIKDLNNKIEELTQAMETLISKIE